MIGMLVLETQVLHYKRSYVWLCRHDVLLNYTHRVLADCSAFCLARLPAEGASFRVGVIKSSSKWLKIAINWYFLKKS